MTPRLGLPMIVPGQAQKEMTHNEALALLAIAIQASVEAVGIDTPPAAPTRGACWVVGAAPTGAWAGQAQAVAGWTDGGWRFVTPHDGFTVHVATTGRAATFRGSAWQISAEPTAIAAPTGGDVVDPQARNAIALILSVLRGARLVAE